MRPGLARILKRPYTRAHSPWGSITVRLTSRLTGLDLSKQVKLLLNILNNLSSLNVYKIGQS